MNIILHRTQNTVGGNIIEVVSKNARVVLDCGTVLEENKVNDFALTEELFGEGAPEIDAVFLTHYHKDHGGLIGYIPQTVPIYVGGAAEKVLRIVVSKSNAPFSDDMTFAGHLRDGQPITVKDISVTPFLCDHSAYDSYMLLLECGEEKILYTGDFRSNGRKSYRALLAKLPTKIDTLICEGTNIGNGAKPHITEADLEKRLKDIFAEMPRKAPVFVLQPITNINRIVTVYRAATASGRVLAEDVETAEITSALGGSIPNPNTFCNVYAFMANGKEETHKKLGSYVNKAGKDFFAAHPFVMCVRSSILGYLKSLSKTVGMQDGILVYSMWNGYKANPDMAEFLDGCRELGLRVCDCHCSGHADAEAIAELVKRVRPDSIIPVHTDDAERFSDAFPEAAVIKVQPAT